MLADKLWHCLHESLAEAAQQQWEVESSRSVLSALEPHAAALPPRALTGVMTAADSLSASAAASVMHAGLALDYDAVAYEWG